MTTTARAAFARHYAHLGPALRVRKVRSAASNQHHIVETATGRYFLKVVLRPDTLYTGDGAARLCAVAAAVVELGAAGLPVEQIEAAADGRLAVGIDDAVYRLFRFIDGRPFSGGTPDLRRAAAALGAVRCGRRRDGRSRRCRQLIR